MTPEFVIGFARQSIELALIISLPMLGIGLAVGVIISVLQAATQIQEMTLTFIPKILAVILAMVLFGSWMLAKMLEFTISIFNNLPNYVR